MKIKMVIVILLSVFGQLLFSLESGYTIPVWIENSNNPSPHEVTDGDWTTFVDISNNSGFMLEEYWNIPSYVHQNPDMYNVYFMYKYENVQLMRFRFYGDGDGNWRYIAPSTVEIEIPVDMEGLVSVYDYVEVPKEYFSSQLITLLYPRNFVTMPGSKVYETALNIVPVSIPEPGSVILLCVGICGLIRRFKK